MTANLHILNNQGAMGHIKGLLMSLVPRAKSFIFYDAECHVAWKSDSSADYEVDRFIAEQPDDILNGTKYGGTCIRSTLPTGRTVLLLRVRTNDGIALGVLAAIFSRNAGKASWFDAQAIEQALLPIADVIAESVQLRVKLGSIVGIADAAETELQFLYQLDQNVHGVARSHSGLAQLVSHSGRYLGVAYSVLLLPAKRIRISATHSTWKDVDRKALDSSMLETLFPRLQDQHEPVIFEVPARENSTNKAEMGYQVMLCPMLDARGNVEGAIAQVGRVSGEPFSARHIRLMAHIARKAEHVITQSFDAMTGLMNRSGFDGQLEESSKNLEGSDGAHQLLHFDVDNLQLVNDSFGHEAGDDVIRRFAQLIESVLPRNGCAARLTADEFVVLLTQSSCKDAEDFANLIRKQTDQLRYLQGDKSLQVTVSVGIAEFEPGSDEPANSLRDARIACQSAKDHGRDRVEIYDHKDQSIIRRNDDMQLVTDIQRALESDGLELYAQAIESLAPDGGAPYFEILLRMRGINGEMVPSGALFSAAERYQLMPQIDRWVVSTTLKSLRAHLDYLTQTGATIAVNLSGQSLSDDDIRLFIEEEITASGIPPGALCFEITESAAVANHKKAQAFIDALRHYGCKFSLDDFGAGLSSFAYLKTFKVDTLKIDGSFIVDIDENVISESMVAAITQVAKVMELTTVAEFVETNQTKTLLRKIGVDFAQGYGVGKPMPLAEALGGVMTQVKAS
ncbi:MAG: EAL domain-containing protein [Woeseia sp.]|nr:EAL domain-containing protein [Woeseia sp.]